MTGALLLPALVLLLAATALYRRTPVMEPFVAGVRDGLTTLLRVWPFILAMMVAIEEVRQSGILPWVAWLLGRFVRTIPQDVFLLMLLHPLSGAAATALGLDILRRHGPDSTTGWLASVASGSAETTFYVLTVYLGAVGIRRAGRVLVLCLVADVVGFALAVLVATWWRHR